MEENKIASQLVKENDAKWVKEKPAVPGRRPAGSSEPHPPPASGADEEGRTRGEGRNERFTLGCPRGSTAFRPFRGTAAVPSVSFTNDNVTSNGCDCKRDEKNKNCSFSSLVSLFLHDQTA